MGAPGSLPGPGGDRPARSTRLRSPDAAVAGEVRPPAGPGRVRSPRSDRGRQPHRMLRLLHTADVHLGARHADLGDAAAAQRERQFAAFVASVDLALAEKVDLFLVAGDLFDSNVQPRRSVERVAARARPPGPGAGPLGPRPGHPRRLRPRIGLPRLRPRGDGGVEGGRRARDRPDAGSSVGPPRHARCRRPRARVRDQARAAQPAARPRRRRRHRTRPGGSAFSTPPSRSPAWTEHDDVVITQDEIAASGLDYLALGHWHGAQVAKARGVTYAYAGAPEPVALDQDKAGKVLLVTLDAKGGTKAGRRPGADRRPDHVRAQGGRRRDRRVAARAPRRGSAPEPTRTASSTCG